MAIANNNGGKQALETVQRLLPVLCQDHGLTPTRWWPSPAMAAASRRWRALLPSYLALIRRWPR
ncbi:hypothetical protein [Xanthomonas oryzae]|uniref:hypothetical protein n=1 Tax=Xanthomonas oryzae TaxID=347 RepID=UPI003D003EBE